MPDSPRPATAPAAPTGAERRTHLALRALVEEMLTGIRDATNSDAWSAEERARAEADLARIMDEVRRTAFTTGGHPPAA